MKPASRNAADANENATWGQASCLPSDIGLACRQAVAIGMSEIAGKVAFMRLRFLPFDNGEGEKDMSDVLASSFPIARIENSAEVEENRIEIRLEANAAGIIPRKGR